MREVNFGATVDELVRRCEERIRNREVCLHPRPRWCVCAFTDVRECARYQLQVRLQRELLRELRGDLPTDPASGDDP